MALPTYEGLNLSNDSTTCAFDDHFGPNVVGCRDDFDFTLMFEQSILSLGPSALLLIVSIPRMIQLQHRSVKTNSNSIHVFKLAAIACAACLRLALLVLWIKNINATTRVSIAASALSFIAISVLALLSNAEHTRSVRPSRITNVYIFFSTLLDLAQTRTLWLISNTGAIAATFTACIAFNLVLLVLEALEKRSFLKEPYCKYPPEVLGNVFNTSIFWWLNQLFLSGYKRVLHLADLFEIDDELSSHILQQRMRSQWRRSARIRTHSLLRTTLSCFRGPLLKTVFPRLCVSALKFSQPLLIRRAVTLISQPRTHQHQNFGYGLIGATALIYIGLAIGNAHYKHKAYRAITMVRGGLISLISDVTLLLNVDSAKDSAAVTLMSTDVDRIIAGLENSDFIWASPIEIGMALYLLYREVGLPCLVPLGISIASAAAAFFIGKAAAAGQRRWVDSIQKRVAVTASMLGSMKAVKMMGLTEQFRDRIQGLKMYELKQSNRFRRITTTRNGVSNFSNIMAPALTFAVYSAVYLASSKTPFNPASAFTSLSIIALLSQAIQWWVIALFTFQASLGCYERIQNYLLLEARDDPRLSFSSEDTHDESSESFNRLRPVKITQHLRNPERRRSADVTIMTIENGSFTFSPDKPPIIRDINLRIQRDSLTMVVGPVGSGKSTLLRALLGEMSFTNGAVHASLREIGYCSQEPWLPNVSVRQAITGFCDFEELWYQTVVRACALNEDIIQFPNGDATMIGSKGISLSGGQKQRLAIGRSLYSRRALLLLDDVLSGLDPRTERAVFRNVLGKGGICRDHGITVILVTHAVKHLEHADHVIVLSKDGTIAEQGPLETLKSRSELLTNISTCHPDDLDEDSERDAKQKSNPQQSTEHAEQDIQSRLEGDLKIYPYWAKAAGSILILYFILQALTTFLMKFPDVWLRWWSAAEVVHPGQRTHFYLGIYCMFAGLTLCSMVVGIMTLGLGVMPRSSAALHRRLLNTVMSAPYSFLAATDSGIIVNRFSQDMSLIDLQLPTAVLQTTDGFMVCVAQAVLISASSKFVATLIPAAILVLYILQRFYLRTSRQIRLLDLETKSPMYSHFLETLSGLTTIRAFHWQSAWDEKSRKLLDQSQRPVYLLYCIQRWLGLALDGMVAVFAVVIIALATQLEHTASNAGGALGVALVNTLTLSSMLSYLIRAWTDMETAMGAVLRIRDFETMTPSETSSECQNPPDEAWPQQGIIRFDHVDAAYCSPSLSGSPINYESSAPVLKDITLSIPAGSHVGICGRTGSGKSSLLLTLFRLTEITSGSLTIDNIDISTLTRSSIRERLIAIPQTPELFPGTIRSNLDPSQKRTDSEIEKALERVDLWETIKPRGGLDAEADTTPLSHGERQLFALACALLRRRQDGNDDGMYESCTGGIVVLDEPTASVDAATELRISQIVREEFRDWTVLSVAHRLSTIRDSDMIIVMDAGKVAECGRPEELEIIEGGAWQAMIGRTGMRGEAM